VSQEQISVTRQDIERLQYQISTEADPQKKVELSTALVDAHSRLLATSGEAERSADNTRSAYSSERKDHTTPVAKGLDKLAPGDAFIVVTVKEQTAHLDATQRALMERGIAYQEFTTQPPKPAEQPAPSAPGADASRAAAPQPMTLEIAADPEKIAAYHAEQDAAQAAARTAQDSGTEVPPRPLEVGEEVSGEIVEAIEQDGQDFYILTIENAQGEAERVLIPADELEHEAGDEITARRTPQGVEIEEARDYGR
jgi:hypothetical protein